MDIIERINAIIVTEGLNVASFARKIGMGDQTIRGIVVQRRNNPSFEVLSRIIEAFPNVDAKWLLTGRGMMQIPQHIGSMAEFINYLREKDTRIEQLIAENQELKAVEHLPKSH